MCVLATNTVTAELLIRQALHGDWHMLYHQALNYIPIK